MYIPIVKNSPLPAYQQIFNSIEKRILTGELQPEDPLPSIRQLAQDTSVSIITVRRAYTDLEGKDLIYSRPGLGSFVAPLTDSKRRELQIALLRPLLLETLYKARELNIRPQHLLELLKRLIEEINGEGVESDA
ncbi:MAG: GntR family transcriptional regulator [Syntrophomonas sp.]|nr:GntR family transcriptional regulator [Syntrophomonas sp.]